MHAFLARRLKSGSPFAGKHRIDAMTAALSPTPTSGSNDKNNVREGPGWGLPPPPPSPPPLPPLPPKIALARHTLPGEPPFFRKELHFFDDDLRFTRGLAFYADHFPRCDRAVSGAADRAASGATNRAVSGATDRAVSDTTKRAVSGATDRAVSGATDRAFDRPATDAAAASDVALAVVSRVASRRRYWTRPPRREVEVLFEDVASGDVVGWDAELNIPGELRRDDCVSDCISDCVSDCISDWVSDCVSDCR
jgi:hypothetical protein